MKLPLIYADFHNADAQGRVRLNTVGTVSDLSRQQVHLRDGLNVALYSDDTDELNQERRLVVDGRVVYSAQEQCWVAEVDWEKIESQLLPASSPETAPGHVPSALLPNAALPAPPASR
jgi:hypothetical protein